MFPVDLLHPTLDNPRQAALPPSLFLRRNRRSFGLMALLLGAQLFFGSAVAYWAVQYPGGLPVGSGAMWLFYLAATVLLGLGLASSTVVATLSGLWFGWGSVGYAVGSYLLASLGGYALGRRADGGAFAESLGQGTRFGRLLAKLRGQEYWLVFLCRLLPVGMPFAVANVALALAQVRLRAYLLGGLLGMLPRTLLFVWVGTQAQGVLAGQAPPAQTWGLVALGAVSLLGLGWLARRVTT
jgi:uncharacterized membrane protein YdjX (TVP38/TMEM64 family)